MPRKLSVEDLEKMDPPEVKAVIRRVDANILHVMKHDSMRGKMHIMKCIYAAAELDRRNKLRQYIGIVAAVVAAVAAIISAVAAVLTYAAM